MEIFEGMLDEGTREGCENPKGYQNGIFQFSNHSITDTCYRSWSRLRSRGVVNLLEGNGNDNPGANAHVR